MQRPQGNKKQRASSDKKKFCQPAYIPEKRSKIVKQIITINQTTKKAA
ncbi:MAG: hypothetical protein GY710_07305 [Desulfobacteraceae bacterium]|nr:hypothetical protein [Desulfobacteraceae bacterium]